MSVLRSAVLVAITAVVVTLLPLCLRKQLPVVVHGTVEPGFEEVAEVFRTNHEKGREAGSAFSAYYKGKKVVDLWGGYANVEAEDPWQQDTMSVFFSTTKGVAALCIAVAVDRGYLDYEQKVAHYWPDFAQKGKENVTLRQLVNHEAGIPVPSEVPTLAMVKDVEWLGEVLAASEPQWEPGTGMGYHTLNFGWLLTEVLRRVDPKQRTVGQFFKEEIAEPFGIDFFIGLPKEEDYRVANIVENPYEMFDMLFHPQLFYMTVTMLTQPDGILVKSYTTEDLLNPFSRLNTYSVRSVEIPAANGIGTARGMAKLFSILANGGELDGKRLLSRKLTESLTQCFITRDIDMVLQLNYGMTMCTGFHDHFNAPVGLDMKGVIGHYGHGGQAGFFDLDNNLSFAYVANFLSTYPDGEDPRYQTLVKALYNSIKAM